MPAVGSTRLYVLTPRVLELELVTIKDKGRPLERWDFVRGTGLELPSSALFTVMVDGRPERVSKVGFRRRPLYAPLARRDLRISNHLFLELGSPIAAGAHVEVLNPDESLFPREMRFEASAAALRLSPAIHVNQVGYAPSWPKKAFVGYYLGSMGELDVREKFFSLLEARTGKQVYQGQLSTRRETGQPYAAKQYQNVLEADFSKFDKPGEYLLSVPGLGASYRFFIHDGAGAVLARTYALGLYNQRCGDTLELPFSRFVHERCHTARAEVPAAQFAPLRDTLAAITKNAGKNKRHTAPVMKDLGASLFPFVRAGTVSVSGGHHDAGDYGKYTFNSAQLVHELVFAADAFAGAGELDNLGVPESGDGLSDLLQIARREAELIVEMQDSDGGFYFLVRPKNRAYENNVLPDRGDPQVVFPKNTVVTAAATAALAQTASSPGFKRAFPSEAARYLEAARKGWAFLEAARSRYGSDGSYQRVGHYGDEFMHDDELVWAATEMYLATGDLAIHKTLIASFNPDDRSTIHWSWQRMFESYGAAIRSYAFASRTGRLQERQLDRDHLARCRNQVMSRGKDLVEWANGSAYGTSFPEPTKRFRTAGWYFSAANAYDLVTAYQLDAKPELLEAISTNVSYELGANPLNITFLTGVGWKRQREIVHQYAHNDRRVLPPSGIPLGAVQAGLPWLPQYENELRETPFPPDSDKDNPYFVYDRWTDTHNVTTEFTVETLGRGLGAAAWLMARSAFRGQQWRTATAKIVLLPTAPDSRQLSARLEVEGLEVEDAQVVWEAAGQEPRFGTPSVLFPEGKGSSWLEAEALWPDGRRVAAALEIGKQ